MAIQVVPAGNFKKSGGKLVQVIVALRYQDPSSDYLVEGTTTLTSQDDSFTWDEVKARAEAKGCRSAQEL